MAEPADAAILERLFAVVRKRRGGDPSVSYTAELLAAGPRRIADKLTEEAAETARALLQEGPERVAAESADLLYHLTVLWAAADIQPADVWAELARREGTSGLAEKAARVEPQSRRERG